MPPSHLQPRTDVPAAEDWSTRLFLAQFRLLARGCGVASLIGFALTAAIVVVPATTPGTVGAAVLLGSLSACCALGPLASLIAAPRRHLALLETPWRRCAATASVARDTAMLDRLVVFDPPRTLVVRGIMPNAVDLVLHHQELFLCGPDERGHVAIRVPGLCQPFWARVVQEKWRPREREPILSARPLDDPAVAGAFRYFRWGTRNWLWAAIPAVLGPAEILLSLRPLSPIGLVAGGVLLLGAAAFARLTLQISRLYAAAAAAVRAATAWTPVPVTLFPWDPDREVAGLAQLPGGAALVQFPIPHLDIVANIADTGMMWIAGPPRDVIAVGLPHLPALGFALLNRDKTDPDEPRNPLILRGKGKALGQIPALRR